MKNILREFILWPNCKNACKFCHQKKAQQFTEKEKIQSIKQFKALVETNTIQQVLFVGGELFDTKFSIELENEFFSLVNILWNKVDLFYINTNLIYSDLTYVIKFLHSVKDFSKLRFTTSFDILYRFKSEKHMNIMLNNIRILESIFPDLRIMVNTILTKDVCEYLLEEKYTFYTKTENICFIPCIGVQKYAPSRNLILQTLLKCFPKEYLKELIKNMETDQIRTLYMYNKEKLEICTSLNSICGHNSNFSLYTADATTCFICDLKKLVSTLY